MRTSHQLILLLLFVGLSSCDCYTVVKGRVVSSATGNPISGVTIKMLGQAAEITSDSAGQFYLGHHTGSCFDLELELTKRGYKPFLLTILKEEHIRSYKVNTESIPLDFDVPVPYHLNKNVNLYSQDFQTKGDSVIFYMDNDSVEQEMENIMIQVMNEN